MQNVTATVRNGKLELTESIHWPDGMRVRIIPLWDVEVVDDSNQNTTKMFVWPEAFFDQVRQQWGDGPLERPSQGDFEKREDW